MRKRANYKNRNDYNTEIEPDEIFLDSSNLPEFNIYQFEGRIEKAIPKKTVIILGCLFLLVILSFIFRLWELQIENGKMYYDLSTNNRLRNTIIFPERGIIYDRNNVKLAWNTSAEEGENYFRRQYLNMDGLSHIVGYIRYPRKDKNGNYYQDELTGKDGVEEFYNSALNGENGLKITEVNALSGVESENVARLPKNGSDIILSVDSRVQSAFYGFIKGLADKVGFVGGAGIIMDVNNGEILALVSYPEYSSEILSNNNNKDVINAYLKDKTNPFLNRATDGLYTPGSVVKPFMSLAALNEDIIDPDKKILSTGSISIPNPYHPDKKSVFKDWKAHGWIDMREAIAVSSDVYFYEIGGGFQGQKGLGINNIKKYFKMFGFGSKIGIDVFPEKAGTIPDPDWKKNNFDGEDWRIGDTYHTSIGQYGFQVTPLQIARGIASIANGGFLPIPTIRSGEGQEKKIEQLSIKRDDFQIVREGMRLCVIEGTAKGLNNNFVDIAAKTGTAELGLSKKRVNSWVVGFFPYKDPEYVFVVTMESGPVANTLGGVYVMRQLLDWMNINTPQYFK